MTCMVLVGKQQQNKLSVSMIHVCLSVCLFADGFNAKGKCKLFIKNLYPYKNSSVAIIGQFCFINISNSQHSLCARVTTCAMTYLKVKGQCQIDRSKITIFSILY